MTHRLVSCVTLTAALHALAQFLNEQRTEFLLLCVEPDWDHRHAWKSTERVASLLHSAGFTFALPVSNPCVGQLRGSLLTCSADSWCNLGSIPGAWPGILSGGCEVWEQGSLSNAQVAIKQYLLEQQGAGVSMHLPSIWTNVVLWHGVCWPSASASPMNRWLLHQLQGEWASAQLGIIVMDFVQPELVCSIVMANGPLFKHP